MRAFGLLMPLLLLAQDAPQAVIAGTVVDEVTGEPLRRASVVLTGEAEGRQLPPVALETAADGAFRFDGLAAGTYSLIARKTGYLDLPPSGRLSLFPLGSGQRQAGRQLKLTPQGVISGTVFDEEGAPLQGAVVQVLRRRRGVGSQRGDSVRSDDRGAFRFPNLEGGEYSVAAMSQDPLLAMKTGSAVRPTIYPPAEFGGVTVRKGEETAGIDVRLHREPAYRVRVRVDGDPVERASVHVMSRDLREVSGVAALPLGAGRFELTGLTAGAWYVVADGYSRDDEFRSGVTAIEITTDDLHDVAVHLSAGRRLTGTFGYDGPAAAKPKWRSLRIALSPAEGSRSGPATCAVEENGAFAVLHELPGQYSIEPSGPLPQGVYLASILMGSQEYYGKEIDLSGAAPEAVTILYRHGAAHVRGTLEGRVGDSAEERGVAVLAPLETHLRRLPYVRTAPIGQDGTFQFDGVRPGEYLVCHMVGGDPPPESIDGAVRLKVEPSGMHGVQLKD